MLFLIGMTSYLKKLRYLAFNLTVIITDLWINLLCILTGILTQILYI